MLKADHMIDLVWPVGMLFMQETILATALGTNRHAFAQITRNFRTQAGGSDGPELWLG